MASPASAPGSTILEAKLQRLGISTHWARESDGSATAAHRAAAMRGAGFSIRGAVDLEAARPLEDARHRALLAELLAAAVEV